MDYDCPVAAEALQDLPLGKRCNEAADNPPHIKRQTL